MDERWIVRPPFVGEAVLLLATVQGAAQGVAHDWQVVREVLSGWLPLRLYSAVVSGRVRRSHAALIVTQLVAQGATPDTVNRNVRRDAEKRGAEADFSWIGLIADYASAYSVTPGWVRDNEKWPVFFAHAPHVHRHRSQRILERLQSAGIPYIKNRTERDRVLRKHKRQAGIEVEKLPSEMSKEELREWQDRQFASIPGQEIGRA